jgi:hypothetical protein
MITRKQDLLGPPALVFGFGLVIALLVALALATPA